MFWNTNSLLRILLLCSICCVVISINKNKNNNYCNHKGYYNTTDGLCNCHNGYCRYSI